MPNIHNGYYQERRRSTHNQVELPRDTGLTFECDRGRYRSLSQSQRDLQQIQRILEDRKAGQKEMALLLDQADQINGYPFRQALRITIIAVGIIAFCYKFFIKTDV